DDNWDRTFTLEGTPQGKFSIRQHLSLVTPFYARVDSRRHNWSPHYLMSELDPVIVRSLLLRHPDFKKGDKEDAAKRFRLYRFLVRAGMYDQALAELDAIQAEIPGQKEQVETSREELKKLLAAKYVDLIEQAQRVGRHHWALSRVRYLSQQGTDEKLQTRVRALQAS